MEINYSSTYPDRMVRDGLKRIINYDIRELSSEEIKNLWDIEHPEGGEPDNGFIHEHKYSYKSTKVGRTRWNYSGIVEAIVRDKYTSDQMEAITNNMNVIVAEFFNVLITGGILSATKYLVESIHDENSANFKAMQEWRALAKKEAREVLNMN